MLFSGAAMVLTKFVAPEGIAMVCVYVILVERSMNKKNRYPLTKDVHTFHGRDLFAYCAAKLAAGIITFEEVGREYTIEEIVLHEIKGAEVSAKYVKATIQSYDPFGSAELL